MCYSTTLKRVIKLISYPNNIGLVLTKTGSISYKHINANASAKVPSHEWIHGINSNVTEIASKDSHAKKITVVSFGSGMRL